MPQKLVDFTNFQNASSAHLKSKTIMVDGYKSHYYTNGNISAKDTLVLLHGLGDDKNIFVQSANFLSDDYYLILPDLLASGENNKSESLDLSIKGQVEFLNKFLTNLGIKSFNFGGNSMGGHISAAYAIAYPDEVKKLILINAPGLKLDDHIVYTGFGEVLQNEDDLNKVVLFNVAERFKRDIPVSEIEVIENASHSPQLEVPDVVAASINNFIKKIKGSIPANKPHTFTLLMQL